MEVFGPDRWNELVTCRFEDIPTELCVTDHLMGFDDTYHNPMFDNINASPTKHTVYYDWPLYDSVKRNYPNIDLKFKLSEHLTQYEMIRQLEHFNAPTAIKFKNFISTFNGAQNVGRQLLVSFLYKNGWFNEKYCSKNFQLLHAQLDGHFFHLLDTADEERFYRKFFIDDAPTAESIDFFNNKISLTSNDIVYDAFFHEYDRTALALSSAISGSFVNIVSDTLPLSYHPFVTEKPFYNIVMRGLFVSYAQPNWHAYFEKFYGFKKYDKIFDYAFDDIRNPIKRLISLTTMLSKFSNLTVSDWHDLYLMEIDTIEYNYDHYFSGSYITQLKSFEDS